MTSLKCPRCGGNLFGPIQDPVERKFGRPVYYDECLQCARTYYPSEIMRQKLLQELSKTGRSDHQYRGLSNSRPRVFPQDGHLVL